MNCKTTYTRPELTRRSTEQLIRIYNRLFNTNAFDEWFNPFEHRQDMLLALLAEMKAQKALAQYENVEIEPYKALKLIVTADGIAILWNKGLQTGKRKVTEQQATLIRQLAEDGETYKTIVAITGVPQITVFRILKGGYALTPNRWNTVEGEPSQMKNPVRKMSFVFAADRADVVPADLFATIERQDSDFWGAHGL